MDLKQPAATAASNNAPAEQPLPRPLPSFAEAGEDVCLARYFKFPMEGVYVDIGCNNPVDHNNTYLFYRLGWRGLCVDANPMFAAHFAEHRPEDKFMACGVAAKTGTLDFYRFDNAHAVSSFNKTHADFWVEVSGGATQYHVEPIQVKTINDILTEAGITRLDVLSIDVERLDAEVVVSLDFNRWQPRVIAIEDHQMNMANPQLSPIFKHLTAMGYMLDSKTVDTSIYVRPQTAFELYKLEDYRAALAPTS